MNPKLALLKNRHVRNCIILIANGSSLNNMDLSFLKNEITIGLNKIYLGFNKFKFYPRYYVAVNQKVIEQSQEEIKRLNCVKFISNRSSELIPENALTYHINTTHSKERFYTDITQGVNEGWTVTYVALQIAYYLGFNKVIIIGMDHRFNYIGKPNEEHTLQGDDPNHFCANYFGHGQKWNNPDLEHSEESYEIAKTVFEQDNRQIIDATLDGCCQVFEKADYKKLFGLT
jgi:hypothetical protein